MDNWVVGNFESLMGLQAVPKSGLSQFLDVFEIPEMKLSADDVATMLTLNPSTVNEGGQIAWIELTDDQREAVLAQIPDEGI